MIEVENEDDLFRVFQEYDAIVALFYASWCPFCRAFLPTFTRAVGNRQLASLSVKIDDIVNPLWETYEIEVVPTVLYFERGKLMQRLDGRLGIGLSETQLVDFLMRN